MICPSIARKKTAVNLFSSFRSDNLPINTEALSYRIIVATFEHRKIGLKRRHRLTCEELQQRAQAPVLEGLVAKPPVLLGEAGVLAADAEDGQGRNRRTGGAGG